MGGMHKHCRWGIPRRSLLTEEADSYSSEQDLVTRREQKELQSTAGKAVGRDRSQREKLVTVTDSTAGDGWIPLAVKGL